MTIKTENRSGIIILHLSGDLDARHSIEAAPGIPDLTENGTRIVIDLHDVHFISSAGISQLVQLNAASNTRGGRMVLAAPSPFFERVLQTTQLDRFFIVAPTVEDAVAKLVQ